LAQAVWQEAHLCEHRSNADRRPAVAPLLSAMSRSRAACAACLVVGAAAAAGGANGTLGLGNYRVAVATFGGDGLSGSLSLQLVDNGGFQAVRWTTSDIAVPVQLIQDVCGDLPDEVKFAYSIDERWTHFLSAHGQGKACGELWTGGPWDPTAACGKHSRNGACSTCDTKSGYQCSPESFEAGPDAKGSYAYRFLNEHACELGDLSGMKGELEAVAPEDNETESVTIPSLALPGGLAQMSAAFGRIGVESVSGSTIGLNCDASGPPAAHGTNCKCTQYNGKRSPSVGTVTAFRPVPNSPFYLAGGPGLRQLQGKSVVVRCGSSFGDKAGEPLFCAALK